MTATAIDAPSIPARRADDPRRELMLGGAILAAFLSIAIGWGVLAPLGAAANAPGEIKVSGERQAVQTLKGGIVTTMPIREGAEVKAGDLLIGFAGAAAMAEEHALATRVIDLQAEIARLEADRAGAATIVPPADFALLSPRDRAEAERAIAGEIRMLGEVRAARAARQGTFRSQLGEVDAQVSANRIRRDSADTQHALNQQELAGIEALAAKGYASKSRVLGLKRSGAALEGEVGAYTAEIGRLHQSAAQARFEMAADRERSAEGVAERLRAARAELQALLPQWRIARDGLAQTELRAPVAGSVVGLRVHTLGGIVQPGATLMEIVPANRSLTIEAQIAPADVNQIRIGQSANVRVPSIHDRSVPTIHGRITRISADSLVDERTGRSFYTASVLVPGSAFDALRRTAGLAGRLRPGTPVEVQVPLRARTAMQFWLEPLVQTLSRAGGER
jgi:HlyD family type I secretion membrane fusion protein